MSKKKWTAVDRYISDTLIPADPVLEAALTASTASWTPPIAPVVAPYQGKWLMILAQASAPAPSSEIGTLGGYTTIWLARALPATGTTHHPRIHPNHAEVARENIARAGLSNKVATPPRPRPRHPPQLARRKTPPSTSSSSTPTSPTTPPTLQWAVRLSRPGTLIIVDNVVRDGDVINATQHRPRRPRRPPPQRHHRRQ